MLGHCICGILYLKYLSFWLLSSKVIDCLRQWFPDHVAPISAPVYLCFLFQLNPAGVTNASGVFGHGDIRQIRVADIEAMGSEVSDTPTGLDDMSYLSEWVSTTERR